MPTGRAARVGAPSCHPMQTRRQRRQPPEPERRSSPEQDMQTEEPPLCGELVLLLVLRFLPVAELLRCRAVCRRWRDVALQVDLWRHRELPLPSAAGAGLVSAVLRAAPCLGALQLDVLLLRHLGPAASDTACAVAALSLTVTGWRDFGLACNAVTNQVRLGRLQALSLVVTVLDRAHGYAYHRRHHRAAKEMLLLLLRLTGPRRLSLVWDGPLPDVARLPLAAETVPASLTELEVGSARLGSLVEALLLVHAATLRRVALPPELRPLLRQTLPELHARLYPDDLTQDFLVARQPPALCRLRSHST